MKAISAIICAALILALPCFAHAEDQKLILSADETGAEAAAGLAKFLHGKGVPQEQKPLTALDKTSPLLAILGSSKPGGVAAQLMAEALKDGLAATQADTFRGLMVVQNVWAKGQTVLLFIGHNPAAVKGAVNNGKDIWSSVIGDAFGLQLSATSLYGY